MEVAPNIKYSGSLSVTSTKAFFVYFLWYGKHSMAYTSYSMYFKDMYDFQVCIFIVHLGLMIEWDIDKK